jgi:hypothetical protein
MTGQTRLRKPSTATEKLFSLFLGHYSALFLQLTSFRLSYLTPLQLGKFGKMHTERVVHLAVEILNDSLDGQSRPIGQMCTSRGSQQASSILLFPPAGRDHIERHLARHILCHCYFVQGQIIQPFVAVHLSKIVL